MVSRRLLLGAALLCLAVGALGAMLYLQQRAARCAPTPGRPNLISFTGASGLPVGWARRANGVELRGPAVDGEGFDLDGDGRSIQLLGIGNFLQTPPVAVTPGTPYCFSGFALTDSIQGSATRARLAFLWHDPEGRLLQEDVTAWQPVVLWTPAAPPRDWSPILGGFVAPPGAASLAVQIAPASDDRVYLDLMQLRAGGSALGRLAAPPELGAAAPPPYLAAWPHGRSAAVAFTFDWETAMGGLVHSRSVDDPNFDQDYLLRALRMREGVTTTRQIFAPYGVRATYYATGYNFLLGNPERRRFMGDPTFTWAKPANGWLSDRWISTPWFADDPFGTLASHPEWYFGDLVAPLRADGHTIQSHTFSHLHGGLAELSTWQQDLQTWNSLAAERGVAPARSLAFPWSSSAGMSDAAWELIEQAGITSVTRLSDQAQYSLWELDAEGIVDAPRCRWLPGREGHIIACPDFYVTPARLDLALRQLERAVASGGMIDLWAHTEEVTSPEQLAAWRRLVAHVADDRRLWVAPLDEIAAWQAAAAELRVEQEPLSSADGAGTQRFMITNPTNYDLIGLGLHLPATTQRVTVGGVELERGEREPSRGPGWSSAAGLATFDLGAGQTLGVELVLSDE